MCQPRSQVALRDIYRALFRHKWKATLFFVFVMASVVTITAVTPRMYRSESILYVRLGRENVALDPTVTLSPETVVAIPQSRENELNTVAEILGSRVFLEEVVDAVGPTQILGPEAAESLASSESERRLASGQSPADPKRSVGWEAWLQKVKPGEPLSARERAILELADRLGVEPLRKSNLILVTYQGWSPKVAQTVVSTLVDAYLERHVQLNRTGRAYEFLAEETARLREKLHANEERLLELKNQTGLSSPAGQQDLLVKRIGRLEDEWLQARAAAAASEAKLQQLRELLSRMPPTQVTASTSGVGDEGTDDMRAQFYALKLEEMAAASKYTEEHPLLQAARRQAEEAEKLLDRQQKTRTQVTSGPHRAHEEVQLAIYSEEPMLASLEAQAGQLQTQLAAAREELDTFNENQLRIASLEREIEIDEASYRRYVANLEQARIDQELEKQQISNIKLVQPATYEVKPVRPRVLWNLVLGVLVAGIGGLGLALAAEYTDHTFRTPEDIEEKLDLPALVAIPRLKRKQLALHGKD